MIELRAMISEDGQQQLCLRLTSREQLATAWEFATPEISSPVL